MGTDVKQGRSDMVMRLSIRALALLVATAFALPTAAEEVDWKKGDLEHLAPAIGTYRYDQILADPQVQKALQTLLPTDGFDVLERNLQVVAPIDFIDGHLVLSGNRAHHGGEDTAMVWLKVYDGSAHVVLQQGGRTTLYSEAAKYAYLPLQLRRILTTPLERVSWREPPDDVVWTR